MNIAKIIVNQTTRIFTMCKRIQSGTVGAAVTVNFTE